MEQVQRQYTEVKTKIDNAKSQLSGIQAQKGVVTDRIKSIEGEMNLLGVSPDNIEAEIQKRKNILAGIVNQANELLSQVPSVESQSVL